MFASWARSCATLVCLARFAFFAVGQTSAQFTTIYNVPPDVAPESIGSNAQLNLFDGGVINRLFEAGANDATNTNIEVNVFGGSFADRFRAYRDSEVNLLGTEFVLGQTDITSSLALNDPFTINERGVTLRGLLADGSPFDFFLNTHIPRSSGWPEYFADGATLTVTLMLPGDYNGDAFVDAADYTVWRNHLGDSVTLPGDTTRGSVTLADHDVWKAHFGMTSQASVAASPVWAVPEPASLVSLLLAAGCGWRLRARRVRSTE